MLKKIFRAMALVAITLALILPIIFADLSSAEALSKEANGENPLKIVIEPSEGDRTLDTKNSEPLKFEERPDLGDDQVFPFVAGLDSYEK